jgi:hypothetical protein
MFLNLQKHQSETEISTKSSIQHCNLLKYQGKIFPLDNSRKRDKYCRKLINLLC